MVTSETSEKGDLVRWVKEYTFYAADDRGNAWPHDPIYEYGLVMQTSHVDPSALIVFGFRTKSLFIVDMKYDEVETISRAPRKLILPTAEEIKKYEK